MNTGKKELRSILEELAALKLPHMAAELQKRYSQPAFLETGRLELIGAIIHEEYAATMPARYASRLKKAKLKGSSCLLEQCKDSKDRQYQREVDMTVKNGSLQIFPIDFTRCFAFLFVAAVLNRFAQAVAVKGRRQNALGWRNEVIRRGGDAGLFLFLFRERGRAVAASAISVARSPALRFLSREGFPPPPLPMILRLSVLS